MVSGALGGAIDLVLSALLVAMAVVVVLGLWHALLTRWGAVPSWARLGVRLGLGVITLSEAALYLWSDVRLREIPLDQVTQRLNAWQSWSGAVHLTSLAMALAVGGLLAALTIQHLMGRRERVR